MAYGTSADEEHMLAFAPPQKHPAPPSQSQPPPNAVPPHQLQPADSTVTHSADRVLEYAKTTWHDCRPWTEFYSTRLISLPPFAALSDRFSTNLHLYRANYQVVSAFWLALVLLGSIPSVLIAAALFFLLQRCCTWRASKTANLLQPIDRIIAIAIALAIIWITGIGVFTVASLGLSALSIALHASLHECDHVETEIASV